jgi:osmoprotectant transport system permease protein
MVFVDAWNIFITKKDIIFSALNTHILLVVWSSCIAIALGITVGILISRSRRLGEVVVGIAGALYTIPILALLGFLIPIMGIGTKPAVVALTIYSLLPVLRNTYVGINQVSAAAKEAAVGMGASKGQVLMRVELPLAFPVIIAGIRTSVVMSFSLATYATFIGGGGMGNIIMQGMRTYNAGLMLAGTIVVALATVLLDRLIGWLENGVQKKYGLLGA